MSNLKRMIVKYYLYFGKDYPNSTYHYYYQMKNLLKYEDKAREILRNSFIPESFYIGYLNFLRKAYRLIGKREFLEVERLMDKEVLRNKLNKEVLKRLYFLLLGTN